MSNLSDREAALIRFIRWVSQSQCREERFRRLLCKMIYPQVDSWKTVVITTRQAESTQVETPRAEQITVELKHYQYSRGIVHIDIRCAFVPQVGNHGAVVVNGDYPKYYVVDTFSFTSRELKEYKVNFPET